MQVKDENGNVVAKVYIIEQLNSDEEHDNLQIRRLQNLAAESWCTCHAPNCASYLKYANSFLFIPNEGNRILRIQGKVDDNYLEIMSVTNLENIPQLNAYPKYFCWIKDDEDIEHLFNFVSQIEKDKNYNISLKNIFDFDNISSTNKIRILEYTKKILDKYDSQIDELDENLNINEVIRILNSIKNISKKYLDENSKKIHTANMLKCIELLSGKLPNHELYVDIDKIHNPNLYELRQLKLSNIKEINLPNLEKVCFMYCNSFSGNKLEFESLKEVELIIFEKTKSFPKINLPELITIKDSNPFYGMELSRFKSISIPKLKELQYLVLNINSTEDIGFFDINPDLRIDTFELFSSSIFKIPSDCEDKKSELKKQLSQNKELLKKIKEIYKHSEEISIIHHSYEKDIMLLLTKDDVQKILQETGIE